MNPRFDVTARGLSLPNALYCAGLCRDVYDAAPVGRVPSPGVPGDIVDPTTDTHVRITEQDDCVIITFRGSKSLANFITDARAWREPWPVGGTIYHIHCGFMDALRSVQKPLNAQLSTLTKPIVLTGHSLGGALAVLYGFLLSQIPHSALRTPHSIYTFGQPRAGDKNFAGYCGETFGARHFRFEDEEDCVTRLPGWLMGYRHSGITVFLNSTGGYSINPLLWAKAVSDAWEIYQARKPGNLSCLTDVLTDHHIDRYIGRIAALA